MSLGLTSKDRQNLFYRLTGANNGPNTENNAILASLMGTDAAISEGTKANQLKEQSNLDTSLMGQQLYQNKNLFDNGIMQPSTQTASQATSPQALQNYQGAQAQQSTSKFQTNLMMQKLLQMLLQKNSGMGGGPLSSLLGG